MKIAFEVPDRFCRKHGSKMNKAGISEEYNTQTGAVKNRFQHYKCPRWFCFEEGLETLIFDGIVQLEHREVPR